MELLLETELSEEQRRYVEWVQESGTALLTTVNNLLDSLKIEAGEIHLEDLDFDLRITVVKAAGLLKKDANTKGPQITCLIHHDVPMVVRGDPGRLRQILTSFLSRAVRFTDGGQFVLRAKLVGDEEEAVTIRFEVTEADTGLNLEESGRAAQGSAKAERPRARRPQGTGLGFAVSKRLAQLMGGQFGMESESSQGRTVWLSVRLGRTQESNFGLPTPRADLRGLSALVVGDNEATHKNLVAETLSWGMRCDIAMNASQALGMLRAAASGGQSYDLAILDMQMPGTDGLELARAIQRDPALSEVQPIILIAVGLRGHAEESRRAGIAGYLTKPVSQSDLYNCLTTVMGARDKDFSAATRPPQQLVTSHNLKEAKARRSTRVLIAEDNTVNQMVEVHMLEKLGVQVNVALNGVAAIEACKRTHYDLVLMDCQMPDMDGFAATRAILESEPARGSAHVPIVAVTASTMQGDREKCLAAGMDDYIAKPFRLDQIRALLARWVPSSPSSPPTAEAPAASNRESAIDKSFLEGFGLPPGERGPNFFAQLRAQFLSEAHSRLTAIHEAVERADATTLKEAAHGLNGSSGVVGAKTMAALCAELEKRARAGGMNGVAELVAQLEDEFGRVREELNAQPGS